MRILLIGRYGQIGWELERALPELGSVVATDRTTLDLTDFDSIRRAVDHSKPDVIINAAAYTAVDRAESEPGLAMQINGRAPGVLAEEAKRTGAVLVHYSTDYVFSGTKAAPYTEDDVPVPLNVYGRTKLEGERAITASGCRHFTLRTSWVYGSRGHNFLLTILRASRKQPTLRVVDDQIGAPTWCRDIAGATVVLLRQPKYATSGLTGVFHLCARGCTSWYGFARRIFASSQLARLGIEVPRVHAIPTEAYHTCARRPSNSQLDCSRLANLTNIALPSWEESLEKCMTELSAL